MNRLTGKIESIETSGSLSVVNLSVGSANMKSIVTETPETAEYLEVGKNVDVLFKETEVIIGKGTEHAISLRNRLICKIEKIEKGDLLGKLTLKHEEGTIMSVITANAVHNLGLEIGETVTALIKTNEIMLAG
ncbi:MAG: TOBE domain-containing protein [Bacteroidota bacterium]